MPRKAADMVAVDIVKSLMEGMERIAAERVNEKLDELSERVLANLPEVVALPSRPADEPMERLLDVGDVAKMLRTSTTTVQKLMDSGALVYVLLDPSSTQRKVPYSWVVEYIHSLPRYVGKSSNKRLVEANYEGLEKL